SSGRLRPLSPTSQTEPQSESDPEAKCSHTSRTSDSNDFVRADIRLVRQNYSVLLGTLSFLIVSTIASSIVGRLAHRISSRRELGVKSLITIFGIDNKYEISKYSR